MLTLSDHQPKTTFDGSADTGSWQAGLAEALVHPGFVRWSSKEAGLVLDQTRFVHQTRDLRPAGQAHKEVLAEMMRRGLWRPYDKLDFARLPDGRLILVNGHHRLGAQVDAQRTIEWTVVVHDCADEKEVASLYHVFDTNVRKRTEAQIIDASGVVEDLDLSKTFASALFSAVPLIAADLDPARKKRDQKLAQIFDLKNEVARDYAHAAKKLEACFAPADGTLKSRLLRPGTFAVALVTMRHQERKAEAFWGTVAENDKLPKGDPRHTLVKTLLANDAGSNSWLRLAWASAAWNAWMRGETPRNFSPGDPRPVKLTGTPFERRR